MRASRISPLAGCDGPSCATISSAHSPRMPKPAHHARLPFDIGGTQFRTSFRKTAEARPAGDWPSAPPERPTFHSLHLYYATAGLIVLASRSDFAESVAAFDLLQIEIVGEHFLVGQDEFLNRGGGAGDHLAAIEGRGFDFRRMAGQIVIEPLEVDGREFQLSRRLASRGRSCESAPGGICRSRCHPS